MCQVVLATYGSAVDFTTFHPERGNALHVASKLGLTEMAKEILSQGYQRLLLEPAIHGEQQLPLFLAVQNEQWRIVAVFLEALSYRWDACSSSLTRSLAYIRNMMSSLYLFLFPQSKKGSDQFHQRWDQVEGNYWQDWRLSEAMVVLESFDKQELV